MIDFEIYEGNAETIEMSVFQSDGETAVDLSSYNTIAFRAYRKGDDETNLAIDLDDSGAKVSGDASGKITVDLSPTDTDLVPGIYLYEFRIDADGSNPRTVAQGYFKVVDSAFA